MTDTLPLPSLTALLPALGSSPSQDGEEPVGRRTPRLVPVAGLAAAQDLLDELEIAGTGGGKLVILGDQTFAVRVR
jgi:hypothetical protein